MAPTVPFTLGRLGIPIFGNKAIPSWLWHSPNDHFFLFLSQAENDLPPHGQRLTGTEPGPLIEERTWLYTLLLLLSLPLSFSLSSSFLLLTVFVNSLSYSISVISNVLFFIAIPASALISSLFPTCTPFLSSPVFPMSSRYSSYSPGDALIPRFSPQSTDRFKGVLRRP